jgi:hypothetical protein
MLAAFTAVVACAPAKAQAIGGLITGTVQDASGAVIPNAKVTLTNQAQGEASARAVPTTGDGIFVFTPVLPGTYEIKVEMTGFKTYVQSNIAMSASDRLGLPAITLEVGAPAESVTVTAEATLLATETAERAGVVTGKQMVDLGLNGRNFTGLLKLVPGVSADNTGNAAVNGQRADKANYTVDGQSVVDIGVNVQFAYRINVDAIAELKVATNAQNAEFGRNSGAQIQVTTRSGTQDFHGTLYWFKRGEWMNANTFTNNQSGLQRPAYRFMTAGYTAGGPIYIPGKMNTSKDRLFGFMSHEWNRQFTPPPLRRITVPTAAERGGDFSNTRDAAGIIQPIRDPLTRSTANPLGTQFPGNIVPVARFNEHGPSVLNWLPLPNVTGQPNFNYQSQVASESPSYDQVYRVDWNISDKWRFFSRHLNSKNTQNNPYGRADSGNNLGLTPFYAPTYGWSLAANLVTLITPTITNEFQFGYTVNGIPGDPPPPGSPYYRSVSKINIPLLYPNADPIGLVPNFNFGGTPTVSGTQMTSFAGLPYDNRNPVWNWTDNFTKVTSSHTIKAGIFIETATKTENPFRPVNGTINFGRDSNNPGDSNWAFSNALLGNFQTYSQFSELIVASYPYRNIEFYVQDTWKVNRKLTLNYGLRIAFIKPFHDTLGKMANFDYNAYSNAQAVSYYQPTGAPSGPNRRAINPFTGEILPANFIGAIIPGQGNINNGMVLSGQGSTPLGLIEDRGAHWAPRFGLAYNFDNKTVFRMGGGVFYERVATFGIGITSDYVTNPPSLRLAELYYGNLSTIRSAATVFNPASITRISPDGHVPTTYNYNAGIQRELPMNILLDVSYVGSQSRHLSLNQWFNNVPFGSAWQPYSQDPTFTTPMFDGTTNLPVNMYRPIRGYGSGVDRTWGGSSNYNALQVALTKRAGALQFGVNYMWSKALGTDPNQGAFGGRIAAHPTDARKANYGPLGLDRTQSLAINYTYDLPSPARYAKAFDNAVGRVVFNGWQLTGITSIASGAPTNVTYTITGVGAAALNRQITGSEDIGPRVVLTCNPNLSRDSRTIDAFINTSCFAPASKGSIGIDSGFNRLRGPGLHQWDVSLFKNIVFNQERGTRAQLRLEAYNVFNHAQWGSFNSSVQFNSAGQVVNRPTQLGGTGGRFGFGSLNEVRANSQRILQIAAKLYF